MISKKLCVPIIISSLISICVMCICNNFVISNIMSVLLSTIVFCMINKHNVSYFKDYKCYIMMFFMLLCFSVTNTIEYIMYNIFVGIDRIVIYTLFQVGYIIISYWYRYDFIEENVENVFTKGDFNGVLICYIIQLVYKIISLHYKLQSSNVLIDYIVFDFIGGGLIAFISYRIVSKFFVLNKVLFIGLITSLILINAESYIAIYTLFGIIIGIW